MKNDKNWFDKALDYLGDSNFAQALVAIEVYTKENPLNKPGKLLKAVIHGELSNYDLVLQILSEIEPTRQDGIEYVRPKYMTKV